MVTNELYYLNKDIRHYGYWVQWEPLDDGPIIDTYCRTICPNEDLKTTYEFINKSVQHKRGKQ